MVLYYGWQDLRNKVLKRDNCTCVKCGAKHVRIEYVARKVPHEQWHWEPFNTCKPDKSAYVADHIIPIACGGDEWDINNIQTLCIKCNKIKTAHDQAKIAELRAIEKKLANGQQQLALNEQRAS